MNQMVNKNNSNSNNSLVFGQWPLTIGASSERNIIRTGVSSQMLLSQYLLQDEPLKSREVWLVYAWRRGYPATS